MATTKDRRTKAEIITQNEELKDKISQLESKKPSKAFHNFDRILKVLLEVTGLSVAIIVGCQTCNQTTLMEGQNTIMAHQDTLMKNQNDMMQKQNDLFASQNEKFDAQNNLVVSQNGLLEFQNSNLQEQNNLMSVQNERILEQTYLSEASRRSSLVSIMGEVINQVGEEVIVSDNGITKGQLRDETISKIAALSYSLTPYKYFEDGNLIPKELSPERGQLLLSLAFNDLDSLTYQKIFFNATFEFSDLRNVNLSKVTSDYTGLLSDFVYNGFVSPYIFFEKASIDSSKYTRNLKFINLRNANLKNSILYRIDFSGARLDNSDLRNAKMTSSIFKGTSFEKSDLRGAVLVGSDIEVASFKNANLEGARLNNAILTNVLFIPEFDNNIKNVNFNCSFLRGTKKQVKEFCPQIEEVIPGYEIVEIPYVDNGVTFSFLINKQWYKEKVKEVGSKIKTMNIYQLMCSNASSIPLPK